MSDLRTAAQQALEAIDWLRLHLQRDHQCLHMDPAQSGIPAWINRSEKNLRAALAEPTCKASLPVEPVQEPVGWLYPEGLAALKAGKCWTVYGTKQDDNNVPIYDAVAPRAEPRASESGAGFESLPASPEPVQEPVIDRRLVLQAIDDLNMVDDVLETHWVEHDVGTGRVNEVLCSLLKTIDLATPPQRKPLTDKELSKIINAEIGFNSCVGWEEDFARAIERAHGIGGQDESA